MRSKVLAFLSGLQRLLAGFAMSATLATMGTPTALYFLLGYIAYCIPMCILGETWQDRLFSLSSAALLALVFSIPFLCAVLT